MSVSSFVKRYENKGKSIFVQDPKLYIGLSAKPEIQILSVIWFTQRIDFQALYSSPINITFVIELKAKGCRKYTFIRLLIRLV